MANENQQPAVPRPALKVAEQVGLRVSLIPEQEEKINDPRIGFGKFILIAVIGALLIAAVGGYLRYRVYADQQEIANITADIQALGMQSETAAASLKEAKLTQTRLAALSTLLPAHRNSQQVFGFFEKHTLADVSFSSISIGENAVVNLSASAGSFESYAAQINELRAQSLVKNVLSSGLNPVYDEKNNLKQVDFALAVTFDPAIFTGAASVK